MSSDRDLILGKVRGALAPLARRAALPDWEGDLVHMRALRGDVDAWTLFVERLRLVNGQALTGAAALASFLREQGWMRGYCDPALYPEFKDALSAAAGFTVETAFDRTRIDDFQFGITRAAAAVAETGTVVLNDAATSSRLGALAPWVHVAVLRRAQIHLDLQQAVTALGDDPNVVFCTGPSKTADVEGILIEGVHGPGRQLALLLE